jgi:DNA-binding LacI/PurR family transcriptional regulator
LADVAAYAPAEQAAHLIRQWITAGELPPGKRLPSERSLADKLKVSRAAVRFAFETLEREGTIISAPRRARIVKPVNPAAPLNGLMTRTILTLAMPGFDARRSAKDHPSWGGRLQQGMLDAFIEGGVGVLFVSEEQLWSQTLPHLVSAPPRGLVVAHTVSDLPSREALLATLRVGEIPIVVWGDEHEWPGCDVVLSDHEQGSRNLAGWLLDNGCRRLLRYRPVEAQAHDWMRRRDAGFEGALMAAGLPVLAPVEVPGMEETPVDAAAFEKNAHLLAGYLFRHLSGPEAADAILANSDVFISELAAACRILGKTPGRDIVLAGYDNCWADCRERRWDDTSPRVTVDKQDRQIGKALATLLFDRIGGGLPPEPQRRMIEQKLVVIETP